MKKLLSLILILGFSTVVSAQNEVKQKLIPTQQTVNGKMSKAGYESIKPKNSSGQQFDPIVHPLVKINPSHLDDSILPLSPNGNLLSVDGFEVTFDVPVKIEISNICHTPRPNIQGGPKNASCGFVVPCDNPSNRDAALTTTKYYQLVWHVITNGGPSSNIDQNRIDNLMAELNSDYASHNMIFCANPANFYEDAVNFTHDVNTEEISLKNTYNVTPTQVINIYVVGSMTPGGYARFPYDPMGGMSATGGIVLNKGNCSVGTHTLAHEMGHVFGLEHTFSGVDERTECSSCYERVRNVNGSSNTTGTATPLGGPYLNEGDREGDWCSDTNPHDTYSYNCSTSPNSNGPCDSGPWANAPVNNHMSYSFCSSQFTNQQSRRMHCMAGTYLNSWISYGGGICGTLPPGADFTGTPTTWQAPANVDFTDLSTPANIITGWTWTFDVGAGGNGVTCVGCTGVNATFNGQNPPTVTYPNTGLYTVSLTITSANGPATKTKVDYIQVNAPSGDCDTLLTQWETPTPTIITYGFGGGWIAGVPDPANMISPTDAKGVYEGYFSPNPGVTPVGAVRVGLGSLYDPNDDMTFQVVVYDDDGFGAPGAIVGGIGGLSPTQLGVPGTGFFNEFWVPFTTPAIPTTGFFHVGVEIFAGDGADTLVVMTSCLGPAGCATAQGEADASNHIFTSGFGYENLLTVYGADFDVDLIPMLGEYAPNPVITSYIEDVHCDTTFVTLFDTVFYSVPTAMTFTFSDGTVINTTTDPMSIDRVYTTPGPDTVTITAINSCGRADTTTWIIPYNFLETPDAEFTATQTNPVCLGAPGVDFTANTTGYTDYSWDFGDGTITSTAGIETVNHTYATAGTYYVELTASVAGFTPVDTFYLENFESGWPAGYDRFNNDAFTPNAGVNPPFTGTNATAWLNLDPDNDGNTSAVSTSWNGPGQAGDDWMLTSALGVLPVNQRLFWDGKALDANFSDGYEVRISTTQLPANTTNYSTLLFSTATENAFSTTRSIDLSAFAGQTVYIAFRNNSTDQYLLSIDNIRVGTATTGCSATLLKTDYMEVIDCSVIPPTTVLASSTASGCNPQSITFTDATVAGDPATSWLWNFGDGTFSTAQNPPAHIYATAGTYFVSFQSCNAGGCTTDNITITITNPPTISNVATTDPTCASNIGSIVITSTGGSGGFQYSIDNGVTFQASNTFTGLGAATYTIVVEDLAGCTVTTTAVLTLPTSPTITSVSTSSPSCFGGADGSLTITASGGDGGPYTYSNDNGVSFQASAIFTGLSAATYNIVIQDGNSCQASTTATITNPTAVSYSVVIGSENCGASDGTLSLTGSGGDGGPYTYSIDNGVTFQASGSFTGLTANSYNIVIEDASGCQTTSTETVNGTGAATINSITESISLACNGDCNGELVANVTGGILPYVYAWTDGLGAPVGGNSATLSGICAGNYTLTVTDNAGAGCNSVSSYSLTQPTLVSFGVIITNETCGSGNGQIQISGVSGGNGSSYTYSVDNGVTFQASTTFSGLSAATYNVVVEDANGCQVTSSETVSNTAGPSISTVGSTDPQCGLGDGTITISAAGGTGSLLYSIDNGVTFQASNSFVALSPGTYQIIVEDASGCQSSISTITLVDLGPPTISNVTTTDANCGNIDGSITITATGGTGSLQYSIDNGITFQASNGFTSLGGGTYNIVVEDVNGCTVTSSEVITTSSALTSVVDSTGNAFCGGTNGWASITVSGGTTPYTFDWSNDGTGDNDDPEDITNLSAGVYTVDVTDVNGCTTSESVTISDISTSSITLISTITDETGGNDGAIDLAVSGGTPPYTFDWDNDGVGDSDDTEDLTGLTGPTTYNVVVSDANGCTATLAVNVGSSVGISESLNDMGVSIYPNPNTGQFYISFANFEGEVSIELTDVAGKLIYTDKRMVHTDQIIDVNIEDISSGLYMINVKGENSVFSTRIMKK